MRARDELIGVRRLVASSGYARVYRVDEVFKSQFCSRLLQNWRLAIPSLFSPNLAPSATGQGQGVFVSKHSTAIQKRRNYPMSNNATTNETINLTSLPYTPKAQTAKERKLAAGFELKR
jgi:hypothetical protein